MHVMSGVISLKDNATATLRAVRKEQSAFKREVDNTKKSLTKTWDKKYKARLDATAASKKAKTIIQAVRAAAQKDRHRRGGQGHRHLQDQGGRQPP